MRSLREKQMAVRVTDEEKVAFEERAKQEGRLPSEVLLQFVRSYIGEPVEPDTQGRLAKVEAELKEIKQHLGKQLA